MRGHHCAFLLRYDQFESLGHPDKGYSEAQVALTGAEGWLPQRLGHYDVRLEWWLTDGDWKLARLDWG